MKLCKSYSMTWSLEVSRRFAKSYARGTKIFQLITNHGDKYPAWLLAHDQAKWARYKNIIKYVAKIDLDCQPGAIDKHLCSYIEDELAKKRYYVGYTGVDKLSRAAVRSRSKVL